MRFEPSRSFWLAMLVLIVCATALFGQDELLDDMQEYSQTWQLFPQIIETIIWSSAYLPIYAAGLVVTLSYIQRFSGVDSALLFWIAMLWVGGLFANGVGYAVTSSSILAALIAMPLIFGWTVLICTRSWADLTVRESMWVGLVLAVIGAPFFGPTWRVKPPPESGEQVQSLTPGMENRRANVYERVIASETADLRWPA